MAKYRIEHDPELLAVSLKAPPPGTSLVVGLDLGTSCGVSFAYHRLGTPVDISTLVMHMGQWDLSAGPYDSGAIRFVRLRQFLSVMKPQLVVYELVKYTPPETVTRFNANAIVARAATPMEWFGALKATVATWCEEHKVPCTGFPIGTIKKRATGKGNASKSDMIKACNKLFGSDMDSEDYESAGYDNVADSAFVCLLGLEMYANGLSAPEEP